MTPTSFKISVVASALTSDPHRIARTARIMGFTGVQLDAGWAGLDISTLSASGLRELRQLFASESQQLVAVGVDIGPHGLGPGADVDRALDELQRIMEAAATLAAGLICVDIGPLPRRAQIRPATPQITADLAGAIYVPAAPVASPPPQAPAGNDDSVRFSQVQSALEELGSRADRFNMTLALRSELSSFASLEDALRRANCPWFGVDLDPVAILRDEWTLGETLSALGPLIRHVRARDALRGTDRRTRPALIGAGSVDWPHLLADLDAAAYHDWFTIDPTELPDRVNAAAAGLHALRSIALR